MNTDVTELSRLQKGELPIPNSGKIEAFYGFMETVNKIFGLNLKPMTLWYGMCLALDDPQLTSNQLIHCKESIDQDFSDLVKPNNLLTMVKFDKPIIHTEIPFENVLDYCCLITTESTSETGGHRFLPHHNMMGMVCCPVYVLSAEGYKTLLRDKQTSVCPICYAQLDETNFATVGKKPASIEELNIFPTDTQNIFATDHKVKQIKPVHVASVAPVAPIVFNLNPENVSKSNTLNKKGTLIVMKGTVGAGKSTYSAKLKENIETIGGTCFVIGTDKYCKLGMTVPNAISKIKEELMTINNLENGKLLVVIIDTCGEQNSGSVIFDIDFGGWKTINVWPNLIRSNTEEYFAWTLRNVLNRIKPGLNDNHYLNPVDAGINICINVHTKKYRALFGKKIPTLFSKTPSTVAEAMVMLKSKADQYQKLLDDQMPLDKEISKIIEKKIIN